MWHFLPTTFKFDCATSFFSCVMSSQKPGKWCIVIFAYVSETEIFRIKGSRRCWIGLNRQFKKFLNVQTFVSTNDREFESSIISIAGFVDWLNFASGCYMNNSTITNCYSLVKLCLILLAMCEWLDHIFKKSLLVVHTYFVKFMHAFRFKLFGHNKRPGSGISGSFQLINWQPQGGTPTSLN